jgi:hypothetical protein
MLTGILAGVAFVALFAMWVIIPSRIKKHRVTQEDEE